MHNQNPTLSIVTPTYNRGELLKICYASLLRQSCRDFEWIIVDDGSTDDTQAIASAFRADFPIRYVKKENGGKHTALNVSHGYVTGKYVLILDSDDHLTHRAVEKVISAWKQYDHNPVVGIVTFLKGTAEDDPSCVAADEGVPVDIMRYKRTCFHSSDCCEVVRRELFQKYPFPVFPGERFISEGPLWNRISFTHKCVYINQVIYIAEYLEGGLTKSGRSLRIRNPRGGMFMANLNMHPKNFLKRRVKYGLLFCCYGFFAGLSPRESLKHSDHKLLAALCMGPGWILYLYWKRKYG